jgi:hypothetical protein
MCVDARYTAWAKNMLIGKSMDFMLVVRWYLLPSLDFGLMEFLLM